MGRHLRTRYSVTEVTAVFERYRARAIGVEHALALLKLGRRQFFNLLKSYRARPTHFSLESQRITPPRTIAAKTEARIMLELKKEAEIIQQDSNPVKFYNYSYLKETLAQKHQIFVSLPTIIRRAKKMGTIRSGCTERLMIGKFSPIMWESWCNTIPPIISGPRRQLPNGI